MHPPEARVAIFLDKLTAKHKLDSLALYNFIRYLLALMFLCLQIKATHRDHSGFHLSIFW